MTGRRPARHGLIVRCYPPAWRSRYGKELAALIEDTQRAGELTLSARVGLLRGAAREHVRELGLASARRSPAEEVRDGSLRVLMAWMAFAFGGVAFAKLSEHWRSFTPRRDWLAPSVGYDAVSFGAVCGAAVIACGALVAGPSLFRYLRAGGWRQIRTPVMRAVAASAATLAVLAIAVARAHAGGAGFGLGGVSQAAPVGSSHVPGGGAVLGVLAGALTVLSVATVWAWTSAGVRSMRAVRMSAAVVVAEGALAAVLTALMVVICGGIVLWWVAVSTSAPSLIDSGLIGATGPALAVEIATGALVLAGSLAAALSGTRRVLRVLLPRSG